MYDRPERRQLVDRLALSAVQSLINSSFRGQSIAVYPAASGRLTENGFTTGKECQVDGGRVDIPTSDPRFQNRREVRPESIIVSVPALIAQPQR